MKKSPNTRQFAVAAPHVERGAVTAFCIGGRVYVTVPDFES
jgi:hypothetical protein